MTNMLPSALKKALGGKITGKALKKSRASASKAIASKIEGKRKNARKHRDERERSGLELFK